MKRMIYIIILSLLALIAGCNANDEKGNTDEKSGIVDSNTDKATTDSPDKQLYTFMAQVIDSNSSILITPDKDSNEIKSSDRITVSINDGAIKGLDGKSITKDELKPGDLVRITYDGSIKESYPAQITASMIVVTGRNILIDGYLALIDDIYKEDPGLNGDITMIALNTNGWTGLTDIDKEIIIKSLESTYELDIIEGTFDELSEQGLIDKENLYFPNGILITIKNIEYNDKKKTITCSIDKWRSGLGAIGVDDVTAKYKDGKWEITKSGMWIS